MDGESIYGPDHDGSCHRDDGHRRRVMRCESAVAENDRLHRENKEREECGAVAELLACSQENRDAGEDVEQQTSHAYDEKLPAVIFVSEHRQQLLMKFQL